MLRRVFRYTIKFIIRPGVAAEEIAADKLGARAGAWWMLLFGIGYSITALICYLQNRVPADPLYLNIPPEKWYLLQALYTIPIGFAGVMTISGLAHIMGNAAGGKGTFDGIFAALAFTLHIPVVIFMWIPETFLMPFFHSMDTLSLPWPGWIEWLRVFILPFPWLIFMTLVALRKILQLAWWKCLAILLVSSIPAGVIMAVFIR
jgi:hypothetical protein